MRSGGVEARGPEAGGAEAGGAEAGVHSALTDILQLPAEPCSPRALSGSVANK